MNYYICANTSLGYWDFTEDNIYDVAKVIELKSSNRYITDKVLNLIFQKLNEPCDIVFAPGTVDLKSALILGNRKLAFVSNCNLGDKTINLDEHFGITPHSPDIADSIKKMENSYRKAKEIHDIWEKIYISNMDFTRLDSYCDNVISTLVTKESVTGRAKTYKRFFGTTTTEGSVNFIDSLTQDLSKRYYIKGRPGTGKSTFLKKLSAELLEQGFDIEQYYCSFDPKSLDMVVCRELSFCVFDSTAPHEKFPEREGDIILDFYEEAGLSGIDEKYRNELNEIKKAYDTLIKSGVKAFKEAVNIENKEYLSQFEKVKASADIKLLF